MGALEARVDRVECQVEIADAHRHLRLERCPAADAVWARFENKTLPPNELRTAMSRAVETAVKEALGQQVDETLFQNKAAELSAGKRAVPVQAVRAALSAQFSFQENLEWVHQGRAGGFGLVLKHGEASRALHTLVQGQVNWCLYVLSKLQDPPAGRQAHNFTPTADPRLGPKARVAKGKQQAKPARKAAKRAARVQAKEVARARAREKTKAGWLTCKWTAEWSQAGRAHRLHRHNNQDDRTHLSWNKRWKCLFGSLSPQEVSYSEVFTPLWFILFVLGLSVPTLAPGLRAMRGTSPAAE